MTAIMFRWIKQFVQSSRQTKFFVLNWFIYGLALVVTTIYCYARLDFVRSYQKIPPKSQTSQSTNQP